MAGSKDRYNYIGKAFNAQKVFNQIIDQDTAAIVVEEMGHNPKLKKENALEEEVLESWFVIVSSVNG